MKKSQLLHINTEIYSSLADNELVLVQIMAWFRTVAKALSKQMVTHICVTRPQWVNIYSPDTVYVTNAGYVLVNTITTAAHYHPTRTSSGLYVVNCLLNLNFSMTSNDPGSSTDMGPWSVVRACLAACNHAHVGNRRTTVNQLSLEVYKQICHSFQYKLLKLRLWGTQTDTHAVIVFKVFAYDPRCRSVFYYLDLKISQGPGSHHRQSFDVQWPY